MRIPIILTSTKGKKPKELAKEVMKAIKSFSAKKKKAEEKKIEVTFFKSRDNVFKMIDEGDTLSAHIFDASINDWRPVSIGALTEARMYGREIEDPGLPGTSNE